MSRSSTTAGTATKPAASTTPQASNSLPMEKVAKLAYDKWVKSGCKHGCDKQHWYEAEAEVKAEMTRAGGRK